MAGRQRTLRHAPSSAVDCSSTQTPAALRIGTALKEVVPHAASLPAGLLKLGEALARRGDGPSRLVNRDLEQLALQLLDEDRPAEQCFALRLLLEAGRFHQSTGDFALALASVRTAHHHSMAAGDDLLEGRALLALATAHLLCDDTREACAALERLNIHAARRPDAGLKLASMGTAVVVLERMGLLNDARALALKLLDYPVQSQEGQLAHVLNAINGVRISHLVDHVDAASLFVEVLSEWAAAPSPALPDDVWARAAVARAAHFTAQGKPAHAQKHLALTIARHEDSGSQHMASLRALVMLQSAHATATVAAADGEGVEWARESIAALLTRVDDMPCERAELLHAAITLALASRADDARVCAMGHLEALRRLTGARHEGTASLLRVPMTFERAVDPHPRASGAEREAADALWLYEGVDGMCVSFDRDGISLFTERDLEVDPFFAAAPKPSEAELEAPLRTAQYQVAENWAVAVELAAGGTGRQCFRVGRIAAALSLALGFTMQRAVVVDLACRLRHIGRAAIGLLSQAATHGAWDDAALAREQAMAADRILSFAADPTVAVAACVARQRHRWWNGCGPTGGSGGAAIAVEARICAVVDAFVALVDPIGGGRRWSIEQALAQVQAMAGIQLDPDLVDLLTRALEFDRAPAPASALPWVDEIVEAGRLAEAHRRLKKTLELTV